MLAETTSENNERYYQFKPIPNNYENISSASNQYQIESYGGHPQFKRSDLDRIV